MINLKRTLAIAVVGIALAIANPLLADPIVLDLTCGGGSTFCVATGTISGALFSTNQQQPTGTGFIDPFLRIQANGTEQGYNADYKGGYTTNFQEKTGIWTHSVPLSSLLAVTVGETSYFQFLLDANQTSKNPLLSLNALKIFVSPTANPAVGNLSTLNFLGTLAYDLGGNRVDINYRMNSGSGSGDIYAYVPTNNFNNLSGFMILYSKFGNPYAGNDGFEEWAARTSTPPPIPEPASILLVGTGILGLARLLRRRTA